MRRAYYLMHRGGFWYYRFNRESGLGRQDGKTWHSTVRTVCTDPHRFSDADRAKFTRTARGFGGDNILLVWLYRPESDTAGLMLSSLRFNVGARLLSYPADSEE